MNIINISKQKIFNNKNRLYAYELVFKDSSDDKIELSTSVKGTSQLIISSISSKELDKLLGQRTMAFINVDGHTLLKGILDVLDNDRFILNILKDIDLTDKVVAKIVQYKKRGFKFSIENSKVSKDPTSKTILALAIKRAQRMEAEDAEKNSLKKVMMANFEKLNTTDLIYTLEYGAVDIDKNKI